MELNNLFNPSSIAIVGASEEEGKVGNVIAKNILNLGYRGEVFLVNPKHEELLGRKCYKNLNDIESRVDLAIMVIPAKLVNEVIKTSADKTKNYVVVSAGFGEINEDGKAREKELNQIAADNSLNILGPNCLGFIIPQLRLNASFAGGMPEVGNISLVSQSGALAVAIMDVAKKEGLRFSSIISVGNKMQLGESELLEYLDNDTGTKVIGMYLEGIKDGRKFIEVAQKIKKPIVILKAGKTEKAQKAISSHTGVLAGSDEIMTAVFEKTGVIRAENMDEFLGLLKLISSSNAPLNGKVVIVTNAGGLGVLATDAFKNKNIKMAEIGEKTQAELQKFLPEESSVANPVDVLGDADEKRYGKTLEILKKEPAGTVLCLLTPQDQTPVGKIAGKIIKFKEKYEENIITVFMGGERVTKAVIKLRENNIPNFFLADQAVAALDKYFGWQRNKSEERLSNWENHPERQQKASEIIQKAKSENRGALSFSEAKEIMEMYGVKVADFWKEAQINDAVFPVAVKVDSDKVLHKTEKQGLILNIKNQEELRSAIEKIKSNFPGENFIIQPMQKIQTELIIGVKYDGIFGPIIVFGLGGIYTEVFKMVDFLVPPANQEEIKNKVLESKLKFLFQETRGQMPYSAGELTDILWGIGFLTQELPQIRELDINPLLVYNDGKESVAVDIKILI
ncbi:MAG: acetate--CoA ligase family protein [Parcubacteria group bacterium]|jgi:acetyltransferase